MLSKNIRARTVSFLFRKSRISRYQNRPKDFSSCCSKQHSPNCTPLPVGTR